LEQNSILEMKKIRKLFPGVVALDNVDFTVRKGEIHALVGENGAGKSTLMKILSGVYPFGTYDGEIKIDGKIMRFQNIKDSEAAQVAVIYQELTMLKNMNVCENIFLGNEVKKGAFIDWDEAFARSRKVLDEVRLNVSPETQVINLGMGAQQLIEIAKAIVKDCRILVLDEPTAALTETETENLLNLLREFRNKGMSCIFISHKLNEVFSIADRITVLTDGKTVGTFDADKLTEDKLISLMVGRVLTQRYPPVDYKPAEETALEVKGWTVYDPEISGRIALDNISFSARKGEIVGFAGLMGAGRTELFLSMMGVWGRRASGEMRLYGKELADRSPNGMIQAGISYLTEDRKGKGLILMENIIRNMALPSLEKRQRHGFINRDRELGAVEEMARQLQIKTPTLEQLAQNLSGGNQQKVCLGKWLLTEPKVLILDEPTRGIDVGAKYEIYTIMHKLAKAGICILMVSSELPEVLGVSDRVIVVREGKIAGELTRAEATQESIMAYATGGI
jgi:ABC-type sugar transport system ATPase subunit